MRKTAVATAAVLVLLSGVALATTRAYFVEPKELHTAKVAGDGQHGIRQTFVANVDSIAYIEWFVGDLSAEGIIRDTSHFLTLDHARDIFPCCVIYGHANL